MDIKKYDGNLVGVRLEGDDRETLERAAHATVQALGREATERAQVAQTMEDSEAKESALAAAAEDKDQTNARLYAIGAVTKRLVDNHPPVSARGARLAYYIGEAGYTVLDAGAGEVDTTQEFLQHYADATLTSVEAYPFGGDPHTLAWERAYFGGNANTMAGQLRAAIDPSTAS